jgi:hypothetical protein
MGDGHSPYGVFEAFTIVSRSLRLPSPGSGAEARHYRTEQPRAPSFSCIDGGFAV